MGDERVLGNLKNGLRKPRKYLIWRSGNPIKPLGEDGMSSD
jgi:hypothetical protein